jgi:hypothetical protein
MVSAQSARLEPEATVVSSFETRLTPLLRMRTPSQRVQRFYIFDVVLANAKTAGTTSISQHFQRRSGRQACLEQAGPVALAVDFALVVLGREIGDHREFRLAL